MSYSAVTIAILLPDLRGGGAERVAINLANVYVDRGFSVDIVLMSAIGEFMPLVRPEIRFIDLKVKRMRSVLWPLMRYLRGNRPSVLLACMWPLTIIALLARRLAHVKTRVIVAEHTTWSVAEINAFPFQRWLLRATMRMFFPWADGVTAVSRGASVDLALVSGLAPERITTIYNPVVGNTVPTGMGMDGVPERWWQGRHKRVLGVGTLKKIKDYPTLLRAFAILRKSTDARLLILGDGEERSSLERACRDLAIEAYVDMPGFASDPFPFYGHADLHVLSSTGEGFGNVIVEALEQGTPVVSTDCPSGPREILCDGKYGRLVPVGDIDALATAMLATLDETPDREALKARARDFAVDKIADEYVDVLLPGWRQSIGHR